MQRRLIETERSFAEPRYRSSLHSFEEDLQAFKQAKQSNPDAS